MRPITLGVAAGLGAAALIATSLPATSAASMEHRAAAQPAKAAAATFPTLRVTRVVGGLDIPWDVKPITRGRLLITERSTKHLFLWTPGHHKQRVRFPSASVWAGSETGLMGLAVDPKFSKNKRFYTCQGGNTSGGGHDVRVMAWRFQKNPARATFVRRLLTGIPSTTGQHGGCLLGGDVPSPGDQRDRPGRVGPGVSGRDETAVQPGWTLRLIGHLHCTRWLGDGRLSSKHGGGQHHRSPQQGGGKSTSENGMSSQHGERSDPWRHDLTTVRNESCRG